MSELETMMMAEPHYHLFETALGTIAIAWRGSCIVRLLLPQSDTAAMARKMQAFRASPGEPPADIAAIISMVRRYAGGENLDFSSVNVSAGDVSAMREAIYVALRQVRHGETVTYGELAKRAGYPGQARDIGEAMGKNPVPLIVPCHRVVAAGGKIGGFSAPGGSVTKEKMLRLEGALNAPAQSAFGF